MTASRQRLRRRGRAAFLTVLAAAALWMAGRPATWGRAADKSDEAPKAAASELDLIPSDGVAVVSFRFADLWNHEAFKAAREKMMKEVPGFAGYVAKDAGVAPDEIERVTGVIQSMESHGNWLGFITTTKPYDRKKVLSAVGADPTEEKGQDRTLHISRKGLAISFLTDRTFAVGQAEEVRQFLKHGETRNDGPLSLALAEAAGKHLIVVGVNMGTLAEAAGKDAPPDMVVFKPLLKAKSAVLTVDLAGSVKSAMRLTFAGESDAEAGEKAVNAALDLARSGLVKNLEEMAKQKDMARVVALEEDLQAGLRSAKVERKGSAVEASATVKIDPKKTGPDLIDAVLKVRNTAGRISSMNNLKQLALAIFNYNDVNQHANEVTQHFPSAAVYDKSGKPLLSWRVLLLPYIEQDALYKEFHLDEPWDSDHNKKLLEKMPALFAAGDEQALKNHETHYQAIVGKGAIFDGKKGVSAADITDGRSNTILLVEAKKAVPWTKPDDVPFDAGKLVPKLGGLFDGIFNAAMADGSVHSFPLTIKEEKLRALITRNGGEVIEPEK
jgi:hypothetical protein